MIIIFFLLTFYFSAGFIFHSAQQLGDVHHHFGEAGFTVCKIPLVVILTNPAPTVNKVQFFTGKTEFATLFHHGEISHLTNLNSYI